MREGRRGNRGVLRHVEVADVVQREGSGSCAGEARCGGGISESRRPCVGGGFAVSKSLCHVWCVCEVYICGGCIRLWGVLGGPRDVWNLQLLLLPIIALPPSDA